MIRLAPTIRLVPMIRLPLFRLLLSDRGMVARFKDQGWCKKASTPHGAMLTVVTVWQVMSIRIFPLIPSSAMLIEAHCLGMVA